MQICGRTRRRKQQQLLLTEEISKTSERGCHFSWPQEEYGKSEESALGNRRWETVQFQAFTWCQQKHQIFPTVVLPSGGICKLPKFVAAPRSVLFWTQQLQSICRLKMGGEPVINIHSLKPHRGSSQGKMPSFPNVEQQDQSYTSHWQICTYISDMALLDTWAFFRPSDIGNGVVIFLNI